MKYPVSAACILLLVGCPPATDAGFGGPEDSEWESVPDDDDAVSDDDDSALVDDDDVALDDDDVSPDDDDAVDDDDVADDDDDEPAPPDLSQVTWLHTNISSWPEAATLSSVSISGGQICLEYDMAGVWPQELIGEDDVAVVGNPWIFIWEDDQWYAATWEWLRPNQTCKNASSVAGDHIKVYPFDEASGWTPTSGTTYYFMVSGLARFSERNVEERTGLVPFVWP